MAYPVKTINAAPERKLYSPASAAADGDDVGHSTTRLGVTTHRELLSLRITYPKTAAVIEPMIMPTLAELTIRGS